MVHVPVSIDTYHARVASEGVMAGADMVNDVTGGSADAAMLPTVAKLGVPYVLMHLRGDLGSMTSPASTSYGCVWAEVGAALRARAALAVAAGVLPWNLLLDPGLGFSKTPEGSAELLGHLGAMRREQLRGVWGRLPLLVGPSRKRFVGQLTGACMRTPWRAWSAVASSSCMLAGMACMRVHIDACMRARARAEPVPCWLLRRPARALGA